MSRAAQPDNWQDLIAGYALGDLSPEEAEALQQILAEHPELITEVDRLQEVFALMPYALPEHEPPAHLRNTILEAAAAERPPVLAEAPPETTGAKRQGFRSRSRQWLGVVGTLAAVTLVALAVDNYRLRQVAESDRAIIAALQQPDAQLFAIEGTEQATQAAGSIVLDPQQQRLLIVAQNLPQLPEGQAYRIWAMPKNSKQPAYCGQFNSNAAGHVAIGWAAPKTICSRNPAQLLITAESATAPPVPQGDLVMKSRV